VICQHAGCGKPVPEGRKKYCSDLCGRLATRAAKAARARRRQLAIEEHGGPQVAVCVCLGCDRPFLSDGPWNRICPRCGQRNDGASRRAAPSRVGAGLTLSELRRIVEE